MRIFLAGATGVIGVRLVPLLLEEGHAVAGMTRSQPELVKRLGGEPVVCDVYDLAALRDAVSSFEPELVLHMLTDLPDRLEELEEKLPANRRMRTEGTRNLLDAAGAVRTIAESVAFPAGQEQHERMVLDAGGVVLRFGRFYGPGTYSGEDGRPEPPRVHVDEAARRTVEALYAPAGTVREIVEEDSAIS
ncbi:MAG TPA: NAD(P)-dependent oxidoreductase [Gaiellaceae bacterium]|nr:NAD(P)-dependent oxidoreductase [Gaiellaceae bacterium]